MDLTHLDRQGSLRLSDISIREPTEQTYVHAEARADGWVMQFAQKAKDEKYKHKANAAGSRFQALIAESEGRWGVETARFLTELVEPVADAAESNKIFVRNRMVDRAWKELACSLQKYNAYLILSQHRTTTQTHSPPG